MGITDKVNLLCKTKGNKNCHIILRGGGVSNCSYKYTTCFKFVKIQVNTAIMIDCSHGNSQRLY